MCIVGFLQLRLLRYKKKEKIATILRKIDYRTIKIWIFPVEFDLDSRFLSLLHRKVTCNSLKSTKSNPCKLATASKAQKVTLASLQQPQKHKKWPLQACNSSKSTKSDPCKLATAPKAQKVTLASLQQPQKHKKWPLQACNSLKNTKSDCGLTILVDHF